MIVVLARPPRSARARQVAQHSRRCVHPRSVQVRPDGANKGAERAGKLFRFDGLINQIERRYRQYRRKKIAHHWREEYLKRVTVERACPDCGGAKLKRQRLLVELGGKNIVELGDLTFAELKDFMAGLPPTACNQAAGVA